jgi:hypothetical protein
MIGNSNTLLLDNQLPSPSIAFEKLENDLTQLVTINQIRKGTVELERSNFLKMSSIQTLLAA